MKVAIEGCLHGELQEVYDRLEKLQQKIKTKIQLLLICGDFQSIRHEQDLDDMHCPEKYKTMGCFRDYYNGNKVAPILTICIGGNHQAVNSFRESHFGGWIAKNIYFLGQVGSIIIRKGSQSLRITGLSGIYNAYDFKYRTLLERYPLRGKQKITAYHTKSIDIYRLELLGRICQMQTLQPEVYGKSNANFDIFLSHDWPKDMACYGNINQLLTIKPFLKKQIQQRTFGSAPLLRLLQIIQPNYWFSAHMHVKYPALFPHKNGRYTHFLSLDKCLGSRSCLQVLDFFKEEEIPQQLPTQITIEVDPVWIGVLLLTEQFMEGKERFYHIEKQLAKIDDAQKMNALIGKYPDLIPRIQKIGKFSFNPNLEQIDQTFSLFEAIGIPKERISGICYPYQRPEIQQSMPEDEIQLEL